MNIRAWNAWRWFDGDSWGSAVGGQVRFDFGATYLGRLLEPVESNKCTGLVDIDPFSL